jgi:FkbM family methyltransferase
MKVSPVKQRREPVERHAVIQCIGPEHPVVELGAGIGVMSCVTNAVLHNPVRYVVVEANPRAIPTLRQNQDSNCCKFEMLNPALSGDKAMKGWRSSGNSGFR